MDGRHPAHLNQGARPAGSQSPFGSSHDLDSRQWISTRHRPGSHNRLSARVTIWTGRRLVSSTRPQDTGHNRLSARVTIWTGGRDAAEPYRALHQSQSPFGSSHDLDCISGMGISSRATGGGHNRLSARVTIWTLPQYTTKSKGDYHESQSPFGSSHDLDHRHKKITVNKEKQSHNRLSARVTIWTHQSAAGRHRAAGSPCHNRLSARVTIWTSPPDRKRILRRSSQSPFGSSHDLDPG